MSASVPVVVFTEPGFGKNLTTKRKRKQAKEPPKEASIKRLKGEFAKFAAQSVTEKRKYRYSNIVSLGGVPEKEKKIPLPLKRKFEAAKRKRQEKDIELGKLSVVQKKSSNRRSRKKGKSKS